jgi:hypothetical protein
MHARLSRSSFITLSLVLACGNERSAMHDDEGTSTGGPGSTAISSSMDGSTSTGESSTEPRPVDTEADDSTTEDDDGPPRDDLRYDEVQQKSSHNSFQRREAFIDQLVYHRVRSLELDIHNGKTFASSLVGDWYVYHTDIVDDGTSCVHLSDCLEEFAIFNRAVPEHAVVTLWIDLKDDFGANHTPTQLDALLQTHLGDAIVAPGELVSACPGSTDVRSAVTDPRCGWPTLASLQGRFVIALTGGNLDAGTRLSAYLQERGDDRLAFVAPGIDAITDLDASPHAAAVIINLNRSNSAWAADIASRGLVSRVWTVNSQADWTTAADAGAHHLATDKVNLHVDPWAITHDETGWPFTCIEPCATPGPEPAAIMGIEVDSSDIWSTADDGWFLHDDLGGSPDGQWRAFISAAHSHVEKFAKGCLMARTGLQANAAYLSVCRPADDERLRVQIRPSTGAQTTATAHDIVPGNTVDPRGVAFVRLAVESDGTCATGFGSRDGETWVEIASACFDAPLRYQGLAASSHDGGVVRFLFGNVRRNEEDPRGIGDFAQSSPLGSGSAELFDGVLP